MVRTKLALAYVLSYLFCPINMFMFSGGDLSGRAWSLQRSYDYEVRKAHITGDWTYLNKAYGTPLPK
jgi:hypothetical protein